MSVFFALVATMLTSFLPILNKRLLRDARSAQVAWITNAASLPILALGTLREEQCPIIQQSGLPLSCADQMPHVDGVFVVALLASVVLNWAARVAGMTCYGRESTGSYLEHRAAKRHFGRRPTMERGSWPERVCTACGIVDQGRGCHRHVVHRLHLLLAAPPGEDARAHHAPLDRVCDRRAAVPSRLRRPVLPGVVSALSRSLPSP